MIPVVDIYVKLILAVLGFIAPTVTLLLPVSYKGISIIKKNINIEESQYEILAEQEFSHIRSIAKAQPHMRGILEQAMKTYRVERYQSQTAIIIGYKKKLYYLELKEQIKWIFASLFISLVYVMVYQALHQIDITKFLGIQNFIRAGKLIILGHGVLLFIISVGIFLRLLIEDKFKVSLSNNLIKFPFKHYNSSIWSKRFFVISLLYFLLYLFIEYNWLLMEQSAFKPFIGLIILVTSFTIFLFAIGRIWRVACAVIETRPIVDMEEGRKNVDSSLPQSQEKKV